MKVYDAGSIRNVCLLSHGGVGKTTLLEAACFTAKATPKLGKVDTATSSFDVRSDEKERKMTMSMHAAFCEWKDAKINLLDTPGFLDFQGDARAALRVVETAMLLVDAADGIQVGTEIMMRFVEEHKMPHLFFMNGLDGENVRFDATLGSLRETYGTSTAAVTIPMGTGQQFTGVVSLVTKEAFEYQKEGNGIGKTVGIPADMTEKVEEMRRSLMESIAESDEELMNIYFERGELTDQEILRGLAKGVASGALHPLFCGSALQNAGVDLLLDNIVHLCPSPLSRTEVAVLNDDQPATLPCTPGQPNAAFVFKTISEEHVGELNLVRVFSGKLALGQEYHNSARGTSERLGNMYFVRGRDRIDTPEIPLGDIGGVLKLKDTHTNDTFTDKGKSMVFPKIGFPEPLVRTAIRPKSKGDEEKIGVGLAKLREEDPTFSYRYEPDIRQSILAGMGDIHLEVIIEGLKNRFKVEVERKPPKISYRETITKSVKYVEYTHKKQTGGAGQYARVFIDLDPLPRGGGYEFVDKIVGGVIDQSFRPSVDKGVKAKIEEGILAGYPIVDFRVSLVDGKTHPVDSKDVAFQIAGREVFKKAFEMASPILLEPIVDLRVTIPEESTGDVMGDLSSRRGKISGIDPQGKYQAVNAKVPEAELLTYSQALRSLTAGRGYYSLKFSHYEPVPAEVARKIVEQSKQTEAASS